jgi:excisionase family DNA binding protein
MAICFFSFSKIKKMDFQNNKVLSFEQGCEYLGYKKSYVYKMTMQNILPFSKPNGKKIFFDREKLEEWMLSNTSKSHEERQIDAATYENTKGGNSK